MEKREKRKEERERLTGKITGSSRFEETDKSVKI